MIIEHHSLCIRSRDLACCNCLRKLNPEIAFVDTRRRRRRREDREGRRRRKGEGGGGREVEGEGRREKGGGGGGGACGEIMKVHMTR